MRVDWRFRPTASRRWPPLHRRFTCASADAVEDFYRSQTIKLVVSASAGGTYDLAARVFVKHFSAHMPGRPNVIIVNMPGTVGTANWLFEVAEKDGSVIGLPNQSVPMNQVVTPKNVRYDARKFNWIGNLEGATGIIFTYHTSPAKTFRDALTREPVMGVPTRNSTAYQLLAMSNRLLNTQVQDHRRLRAQPRGRDGERRARRHRVEHREPRRPRAAMAAEEPDQYPRRAWAQADRAGARRADACWS